MTDDESQLLARIAQTLDELTEQLHGVDLQRLVDITTNHHTVLYGPNTRPQDGIIVRLGSLEVSFGRIFKYIIVPVLSLILVSAVTAIWLLLNNKAQFIILP